MALPPLDFPASPTVGQLYPDPPVTGQPTYKWDGAQWLAYAAASLPTPTKPDNYGKKNYIINGGMQISQENGATAGTTTSYFPVDQFSMPFSNAGTQTIQQVASVTPGGSPNRIRVTATVADASVAATDALQLTHPIEGLRVADLLAGSASAKTVTLQFGVRAPAGTYGVTFRNGAFNRSYIAEYVIAAGEANTDVVKSITVALDQAGTWVKDNTIGLNITWTLMLGSTYYGTLNTWQAGSLSGTANQFNFMGTGGNVFELFDVSLTEGTVAPPFQLPDYPSELALCQRYWQTGVVVWNGWITSGQTAASEMIYYTNSMRSTATMTAVNTIATGFAAASSFAGNTTNSVEIYHITAAAGVATFMDTWKANARL